MKFATALGGILFLSGFQAIAMWQDAQVNFWNSKMEPSLSFNQLGQVSANPFLKQTEKDKDREVYSFNPGGNTYNTVGVGFKNYKTDAGNKILDYIVSDRNLNGTNYTSVTTFSGENRIWHQAFCRGNECFEVTGHVCDDLKKKLNAPSFAKLIDEQKHCQDIASALNEVMKQETNNFEMKSYLKADMENVDKALHGNTMGKAFNLVSRTKTARLGDSEKLSAQNISMYIEACSKAESFNTTDDNLPKPMKDRSKSPGKNSSGGSTT